MYGLNNLRDSRCQGPRPGSKMQVVKGPAVCVEAVSSDPTCTTKGARLWAWMARPVW